jgi:formylglycine-generating enzyme required for sulfatase activity
VLIYVNKSSICYNYAHKNNKHLERFMSIKKMLFMAAAVLALAVCGMLAGCGDKDNPAGDGGKDAPTADSTLAGGDTAMVFVRGGAFTMGCTPEQGDNCPSDEIPAHVVTVSDFYIGKYEVTQKLWKQIMGADSNPSRYIGDDLPVDWVTWDDAMEFIKRLNKETDKNYRLPTEAEWEYAARGGKNSNGYKYSGSDYITEVAWYSGNNSANGAKPAGTKFPNELGIHDMSGNLHEWVSDFYGDYAEEAEAETNPLGPVSGSARVYRGGSWGTPARDCRVSRRNHALPGFSNSGLGFRLALDAELDSGLTGGVLQDLPFMAGDIPEGSVNIIKDVEMNNIVISGGSAILAVESSVRLNKLYIQIDGEEGYYVLGLSDSSLIDSTGGFTYSVVIQFTQNLENGELKASFAGVSINNQISAPVVKTAEIKQVGAGNLQISLSWNNSDDLDLYVKTPSGGTIYFSNKKVGNGELDLDANVGCGNVSNENIYFSGALANGDYTVWINLFEKCGTAGAAYNVTASSNGQIFTFSPDQRGSFPNNARDGADIAIGVISVRNGAIAASLSKRAVPENIRESIAELSAKLRRENPKR